MKTRSIAGLLLTLFLVSITIFATPAAAVSTEELSYDDGSYNNTVAAVPTWHFLVKFSLPPGWISAKILTAKYYIAWLPVTPTTFKVHVFDSDGKTDLITPFSVNPTGFPAPGDWFDVDLTGQNLVVSDDFYIAIEYQTSGSPRLGYDTDAPIDARSYGGYYANPWNTYTADFMIRAVVERVEVAVTIDIKPYSYPNSIHLRDRGVLTVAVMGSADFDVTNIDPGTAQLGGVDIATRGNADKIAYSIEDVDGDGYLDFVAKFNVQDLVTSGALTGATTELELTAELDDGTPIIGSDSVRVVPP